MLGSVGGLAAFLPSLKAPLIKGLELMGERGFLWGGGGGGGGASAGIAPPALAASSSSPLPPRRSPTLPWEHEGGGRAVIGWGGADRSAVAVGRHR